MVTEKYQQVRGEVVMSWALPIEGTGQTDYLGESISLGRELQFRQAGRVVHSCYFSEVLLIMLSNAGYMLHDRDIHGGIPFMPSLQLCNGKFMHTTE